MFGIVKGIANYLEGKAGEKSSKRLGYIFSLFQLCFMCDVALAWFLWKGKHDLALDLLVYFGGAVLIMGGFVTAEVFKNLKKGKKHE